MGLKADIEIKEMQLEILKRSRTFDAIYYKVATREDSKRYPRILMCLSEFKFNFIFTKLSSAQNLNGAVARLCSRKSYAYRAVTWLFLSV